MKNLIVSIVAVAAMFLIVSCLESDEIPGAEPQVGELDGDCYPNETCNYDLVCVKGVCEYPVTDNAVVSDNTVTDNEVADDNITDNTVTDNSATDTDNASDIDNTDIDTATDIDYATDNETPDNDFDNGYPIATLSGPTEIKEGETGIIKVVLDKANSEIGTSFSLTFSPEGEGPAYLNTDYFVSIPDNHLVIPVGVKEASFVVSYPNNSLVEGDKQFSVRIHADSSGVNLGNTQIVVSLRDNDVVNPCTVYFFSASAQIPEEGTVCVDIRRDGNISLPASIVLRKTVGNISGDLSIDPSGTYDSPYGQVIHFGANDTAKSICFTANADSLAEGDEGIEFRLEGESGYVQIDGARNTYHLTIKDSVYQTKEIVGDNNAEILCTFEKNYDKCWAASTQFTIQKAFTYRILSYTFYCDDMVVGDVIHCQTVGTDYSTDKACKLPSTAVGYTHNADGCVQN